VKIKTNKNTIISICYTYFQKYNNTFSNKSVTFVVQNTMTDSTVRSLKHTLPLYLQRERTHTHTHAHTPRGLGCLPTFCFWFRTYKYKETITNTKKKNMCLYKLRKIQTPVLFKSHNSSAAKIIKTILNGSRIQIQALMNNSRINTSASLGTHPKYILMDFFLGLIQYRCVDVFKTINTPLQ
jgi:hypothetical protein